jgi:signal transduction histidine kinase/DNA-binding response OmpR family regulator
MQAIISMSLRYEHDIVAARQRARQIAALLRLDAQDQTRLATAVSEIARNAHTYAGGGKVEFLVEGRTSPQVLSVRISDQGPGIADLARILGGQYESRTGMGLGIIGARRLMDQFTIDSVPGRGTTVMLKKILPPHTPLLTPRAIGELAASLAREQPQSPFEEIQRQNQELLRALDELRARQDELTHLNGELEDTNRGVVALYAELDEKADHLRRADEMKTRFLSNMSHEFRTPLNSILGLSRLLLDHSDGGLTAEQEKQVGFIRKAADDLSDLVNDLLDLAKVEAGKIVVRPAEFEVANLFGALRGMLRPLLVNESVTLVFDDARALPTLDTDEAKVSQILRNFISNALKFTERGEVRVSAVLGDDGEAVDFSVADTGIGIAPADQPRIFEEFGQVESPLQAKVKGTGLGLPLARKLTELLGGRIALVSKPGAGSTFTARIPVRYAMPEPPPPAPTWQPDTRFEPVLVVEDSPEDVLVYEKFLRGSRFQPIAVSTLGRAREVMRRLRPAVVILDIRLHGEDTWGFLTELKRREETRDIPVLVVTTVADQHKGLGLGADAYAVKPVERVWLLDTLARVTAPDRREHVLVIDDDETARYLVRTSLADSAYVVTEAVEGREGVRRARELRPAAIFLDLVMPGYSGFEVLEQLREDATTRGIPVIVLTSKVLAAADAAWLRARASTVLSKAEVGRDTVCRALAQALTGEPEGAT